MNSKVNGVQEIKKKRSHDLAYLTILLVLTLGIFLFAMMFVNTHLP